MMSGPVQEVHFRAASLLISLTELRDFIRQEDDKTVELQRVRDYIVRVINNTEMMAGVLSGYIDDLPGRVVSPTKK